MEMRPDSSKEIFVAFIFADQVHDTLTTPHVNRKKKRHWTAKRKLSLYNNSLVFLLCGDHRNYESIRTAAVGEKLACWTEGFSSADLDFDNFSLVPVSPMDGMRLRQLWSVSYRFVGILYSSRLILLYSNHLEGRPTVESCLIHTGTSSYQDNDVITFHLIVAFIFSEAGLSAKIMKICTQQKFPAIRY